jgi:uncharacterized protein
MKQNTNNSLFRILLLTAGLLFSTLAFALELDAAKAQGLVGERADGYLGIVVKNPDAQVVALVDEVNDKRLARYKEIAAQNGIDLADVEARAGQRAIALTAAGGWIFRSSWEQKK